MPPLGSYPTPVELLESLSNRESRLWVKRDDRTHDALGGNKVRKLERLLTAAHAAGAKRLVTVGAAGSHHVLATAYFGRRQGFEVEAVLVPQPHTERAAAILRADLALGLRAFPVGSWAAALPALAWRAARGAHLVMLGGSSVAGAMGYVDAARELAAQVRAGLLPEPDVCVVALGSGGTAGGLAAGFLDEGMKTRVIGVSISPPPRTLYLAAVALGLGCARTFGGSADGRGLATPTRASLATLGRTLSLDARFLGRGYGYATPEGEQAMLRAREGQRTRAAAFDLDPIYTAKAFASALWHVRERRARNVLYWHTLSSAPLEPLLAGAPEDRSLDVCLGRLMKGRRESAA